MEKKTEKRRDIEKITCLLERIQQRLESLDHFNFTVTAPRNSFGCDGRWVTGQCGEGERGIKGRKGEERKNIWVQKIKYLILKF